MLRQWMLVCLLSNNSHSEATVACRQLGHVTYTRYKLRDYVTVFYNQHLVYTPQMDSTNSIL